MTMKMRFRAGYHIKNDVATVFQAIEDAKIDGDVVPQKIVDDAKPKNAPLHEEFEWNGRKAANAFRLYQARKVIQSIEIVHAKIPPTRAYEAVTVVAPPGKPKPKHRNVFRSVEEVLADPVTRDVLLASAIRDAAAFRKRYAALQELSQVFAAIDSLVLSA